MMRRGIKNERKDFVEEMEVDIRRNVTDRRSRWRKQRRERPDQKGWEAWMYIEDETKLHDVSKGEDVWKS